MEKITINNHLEMPGLLSPKGNPVPENGGGSFAQALSGAVDNVNRLKNEADDAIQGLAGGKKADLHQTMIAMEKANVSFQLLMQTRNKVIDAYKEMMRMAV